MSKKIYILFFFLAIGLFLAPSSAYACGNNTEKTSCKKETTSKETKDSCQKDCCKNNYDSKRDQHDCNGKCDHSGCTTSGLQFSLIAINEIEFNMNLFNFSLDKSISYHKTTSLSDGFTSIWLPPKIK